MTYSNKIVDGVMVPLTPAEIAECVQRDLDWANQPTFKPKPSLDDVIAVLSDGQKAQLDAKLKTRTKK